ncbi:hypothetical protein N9E34_01685 [Opitutales bacterium]|nr:hypothetical protein [Opitutales bacterium]
MKNSESDWDNTTVTTFGYKNYGVGSNRYRYFAYRDMTEELFAQTKD